MTEVLSTEEKQALLEELKKEHAALDAEISAQDQQAWLSPDEQIERKQKQKLKLRLKDRIYQLTEELAKNT
ncbi:MAG: YdcH family protein [Bradymonadales bacterium]|jgi:hypothetical protein